MLTHKYIQQLLFSDTGATAYSLARFGRGTGGIFLDNLYCTGRESQLVDCTYSGIGVHNCDHSDDAGVRCLGMYVSTILASFLGNVRRYGFFLFVCLFVCLCVCVCVFLFNFPPLFPKE